MLCSKTNIQHKSEAPGWIQKFWFVVICVEEIILFLCYVFAFATMDVLPWKVFILSVFVIAVVGTAIAMGALIDVQLSIRMAVFRVHERNVSASSGSKQLKQLSTDEIQVKKLKNGQRILRAITIFAFVIMIGASYDSFLSIVCLLTLSFLYSMPKNGTKRKINKQTKMQTKRFFFSLRLLFFWFCLCFLSFLFENYLFLWKH